MNIHVGDKIRALKNIGELHVGMELVVDEVDDDVIRFSRVFSNGSGEGYCSMDEFHEFFEVVNDRYDGCKISCHGVTLTPTDSIIQLVQATDELPFNVGDRFVIQNRGYGAVTLTDLTDTKSWTVAEDLINKYFDRVVQHEDEDEDEDYNEDKIELPDKIDQEHIDAVLEASEIHYVKMFNRLLVAACKLPNGAMITASYGASSPETYDFEAAKNHCMKQLSAHIWNLETYALLNCHYNCAE